MSVNPRTISLLFGLGAAWGLTEATCGPCAGRLLGWPASGPILTGVSLLFLAAAFRLTGRATSVLPVLGLAAALKIGGACLRGNPLTGGSVANPLFAMALETGALLAVLVLWKGVQAKGWFRSSLAGGGAALAATLAFPAVRMVTGNPACIFPGTGLPVSVVLAPLAFFCGALAIPAGLALGRRLRESSAPEGGWLVPGLATCAASAGALAFTFLLG